MQVKKEFTYAVEGIHPRTFKVGTEAADLPPDARAYAERKNLLGGKAVAESAENKAVEPGEDKGGRKGKQDK